jgi:hypothetical protein
LLQNDPVFDLASQSVIDFNTPSSKRIASSVAAGLKRLAP